MSDKKIVYFHIGTHKTGTTALQKFFVNNKTLLSDAGIKYEWHHDTEFNQGFLINEYNWGKVDFDCDKNYLLSSEDFYHYILKICDVVNEKLKCFRIRFIVYFKRQDLMKQSVYNQIVKGGDFYKSIHEDNHYNYDYYSFLNKLREAFPSADIVVRPYEKQQFIGGSIFSDFLNILGLNLNDKYKIEREVVNPSLTRDKLELARLINMVGLPIGLRDSFKKLIIKTDVDSRKVSFFRDQGLLSPEESKIMLEKYQEGNQLIARDFLGRGNGVLFYDSVKEDGSWKPYPGLDDDLAENIIRDIWKIEPGLIDKVISFISSSNNRSSQFVESANYLMPLLFKAKGIANTYQPVTAVIDKYDPVSDFIGLKEKLGDFFDGADILRETAFVFERIGDLNTAYELMKYASRIRPEGPVIKSKLLEYENTFKERMGKV